MRKENCSFGFLFVNGNVKEWRCGKTGHGRCRDWACALYRPCLSSLDRWVRSVLQFGKECVADAFLVDAAEVAQDVDGAMLDKAVWNT